MVWIYPLSLFKLLYGAPGYLGTNCIAFRCICVGSADLIYCFPFLAQVEDDASGDDECVSHHRLGSIASILPMLKEIAEKTVEEEEKDWVSCGAGGGVGDL